MKYLFLLFFNITILNAQFNKLDNINVSDEFPRFKLENLNDEIIDFKNFKGKPVFINLWFTGCKPCVDEMPELNKLKRKYADQVSFIAISFESKEKVQNFLKKHDFEFDHLINGRKFINQVLGNKTYPKSIIVDEKGVLRHIIGSLPYKKVDISKRINIQEDYTFFEKPLLEVLIKRKINN